MAPAILGPDSLESLPTASFSRWAGISICLSHQTKNARAIPATASSVSCTGPPSGVSMAVPRTSVPLLRYM